jgi:hypothetical protein
VKAAEHDSGTPEMNRENGSVPRLSDDSCAYMVTRGWTKAFKVGPVTHAQLMGTGCEHIQMAGNTSAAQLQSRL